jgi:hypothetical protein
MPWPTGWRDLPVKVDPGQIRVRPEIEQRYLGSMRRNRSTPEELESKRIRASRGKRAQSGEIPGLLVKDAKAVRPEIRKLIDAAVKQRLERH